MTVEIKEPDGKDSVPRYIYATAGKTREILSLVARVDERDNERGVHIHDEMYVVCTNVDGFDLMHKEDAMRGKGRVYRVKLLEIY